MQIILAKTTCLININVSEHVYFAVSFCTFRNHKFWTFVICCFLIINICLLWVPWTTCMAQEMKKKKIEIY